MVKSGDRRINRSGDEEFFVEDVGWCLVYDGVVDEEKCAEIGRLNPEV